MGMLLYSLSKDDDQYDFNALAKQISEYKLQSGFFKMRLNDDRILIRQEAHLLYGLSHYLYH